MTGIVIIIGVLLILAILFVILRATSLVDVFRETEKRRVGFSNKINGILFPIFFVVGFGLFIWYSFEASQYYLPEASSVHGVRTDGLFWLTMWVIVLVVFVTHLLLFYFPFKYQFKETNKASFFPDNNKLEVLWTVVPAIVLSILIFTGWRAWSDITGEPPKKAEEIEVMGFQFGWQTRYAGQDKELGAYNFKLIDPSNGDEWGMDLRDKSGWDDFTPSDRILRLPKNRPVLFKIRARDVLHSVYAPHFRVKMDAVPGMPTRFWFVPTKTTKEMRAELKKPDFNYELACAELCGPGHFGMRLVIEVVEADEYDRWYSSQKSFLSKNPGWIERIPANLRAEAQKLFPVEAAPAAAPVASVSDSAAAKTEPEASATAGASEETAAAAPTVDVKAGEQLFKTICFACHKISDQPLVGPGLKDLHTRRSNDWIIKFVRNSQALIKAGDKQAVEVFEKFNKIPMPSQDLTDDQILSIVAYIKQESAK